MDYLRSKFTLQKFASSQGSLMVSQLDLPTATQFSQNLQDLKILKFLKRGWNCSEVLKIIWDGRADKSPVTALLSLGNEF